MYDEVKTSRGGLIKRDSGESATSATRRASAIWYKSEENWDKNKKRRHKCGGEGEEIS